MEMNIDSIIESEKVADHTTVRCIRQALRPRTRVPQPPRSMTS